MNYNKNNYSEKLKDPRWQKKRLEIFQRDYFMCRNCQSKDKTLHVHHLFYKKEYENPWEYPNHLLATLCEDCHKEEDAYKDIVKNLLFELFSEIASKTACELYHSLDPAFYIAYDIVDNELDGYRRCIVELLKDKKC